MSDTQVSLRRKIDGAVKLESVVRTMKAVAASRIGQYEAAVNALADYEYSVQLGLSVCFRQEWPVAAPSGTQRGAGHYWGDRLWLRSGISWTIQRDTGRIRGNEAVILAG